MVLEANASFDLREDRVVLAEPRVESGAEAAAALAHDNRAAGLALDDGVNLRVGDEWRAGEHFAAVLLDEEHLFERYLGAWLSHAAGDQGDPARRHLQLMTSRLDDCVHNRHLCKTNILA